MTMRKFALAATVLALISPVKAQENKPPEKLPVVASFSILGDIVQNVGRHPGAVKSLVGPQ